MTAPRPQLRLVRDPDPGPAAPDLAADLERARASALFRPLAAEVLREALAAGHLRVREVWRDEIVADREQTERDGERVHLVEEGQVVAAVFDPDVLADERAWAAEVDAGERRRKIRPQGPLIHLAERHLAVFGPGDLFNSRALSAGGGYAFFASQPGWLFAARPGWLGEAARHPPVGAALGRAVAAARARLSALPGARAEVLDFYVRQGLSAAGTLRVVQVDRCIECRRCETACADRHGVSRLTIPGPRLGLVGVAVTCRTCADRRCLSVCNFDSIEFDERRGEVLVRESSCTGCASCATACPYGAIQMIQLGDPSRAAYRARLERRGSLRAGPDAERREPIEQIASKCDHCTGHGDQACITACPTGALVEIAPADLFPGAHGPARAAAPLAAEPFETGLGPRALPARRRAARAALWALGLAGLVAGGAEIALRRAAPSGSLQYAMLLGEGLEPSLARFNVRYLAGSSLSLALGYAGSALLLVALLHPLRARWRPLGRIGRGGAWFDLHVMGGTLGPLYLALHSAFHLYNWVAIAVWSFAAVVASGAVGRYLLTRLPDRFPGSGTAAARHELEIARLGAPWPAAVAAAQGEIDRYRRAVRLAPGARTGVAAALAWILAGAARRPLARLRRAARLARTGAPRRARRRLSRRVGRAVAVERRAALSARCAAFLRAWVRIHVLFTAVAVIVSIAHVIAALAFSM